MTLTTSSLFKASGAAAVAAGAIFIGVQINHPPADVAHVVTTDMAIREIAKTVMTVLALAGLAGMFLRNRHRFGALGVVGYLLFSIGYLAMFALQVIVACVLPTVATSDPGYVQDVLDAAMGGTPSGDIGGMQVLLNVSGVGFMAGGLLFGIALFRAGVLARWAAALLAVATVATATLAVLPEGFSRPMAVPTGIALIGLGLSVWRNSGLQVAGADSARPAAAVPTSSAAPSPVR